MPSTGRGSQCDVQEELTQKLGTWLAEETSKRWTSAGTCLISSHFHPGDENKQSECTVLLIRFKRIPGILSPGKMNSTS